MEPFRGRWAVLLAGGEGTRLQALTRSPGGFAVPKQFCSFLGGRSLLQMTLERAKRVAPPDHIVPIVAAHHAEWWEGELSEFPVDNVVVQPENKGTAPGILLPLLTILRRWRRPAVAIFPTDHHVDQEHVLRNAVERAYSVLDPRDERIILLGMRPEGPADGLGWIRAGSSDPSGLRTVAEVLEKPDEADKERLYRMGGLVNSFILVARGEALRRLYEETQPLLLKLLASTMRHHGWTLATLRHLYAALPAIDFSRDVLAHAGTRLRVLPVRACGWIDLGTPERLMHWLSTRREAPAPQAGAVAAEAITERPREPVGAV
ncbi:MAG TPA: sugar phosphate nucleotidyltransferase [Candidatus Eisenbacteria bacterium]|jgi:mannose-1-phosphate guanylyltransferase